jgi:hypothetical protein
MCVLNSLKGNKANILLEDVYKTRMTGHLPNPSTGSKGYTFIDTMQSAVLERRTSLYKANSYANWYQMLYKKQS